MYFEDPIQGLKEQESGKHIRTVTIADIGAVIADFAAKETLSLSVRETVNPQPSRYIGMSGKNVFEDPATGAHYWEVVDQKSGKVCVYGLTMPRPYGLSRVFNPNSLRCKAKFVHLPGDPNPPANAVNLNDVLKDLHNKHYFSPGKRTVMDNQIISALRHMMRRRGSIVGLVRPRISSPSYEP